MKEQLEWLDEKINIARETLEETCESYPYSFSAAFKGGYLKALKDAREHFKGEDDE